MKNYLFVYYSNISTAPSEASMAAWNVWMKGIADSIVDSGNPITRAKSVVKDGATTAGHDEVVGYSVVKADSLEAAVALTKGCPLADADGCEVRVYETAPM